MTVMIEAFDKAMALLDKERSDMEDAAVSAHYWAEEVKRLLVMFADELTKTDDYIDWLVRSDKLSPKWWKDAAETRLFKECGEDVCLVATWLEEKGQ